MTGDAQRLKIFQKVGIDRPLKPFHRPDVVKFDCTLDYSLTAMPAGPSIPFEYKRTEIENTWSSFITQPHRQRKSFRTVKLRLVRGVRIFKSSQQREAVFHSVHVHQRLRIAGECHYPFYPAVMTAHDLRELTAVFPPKPVGQLPEDKVIQLRKRPISAIGVAIVPGPAADELVEGFQLGIKRMNARRWSRNRKDFGSHRLHGIIRYQQLRKLFSAADHAALNVIAQKPETIVNMRDLRFLIRKSQVKFILQELLQFLFHDFSLLPCAIAQHHEVIGVAYMSEIGMSKFPQLLFHRTSAVSFTGHEHIQFMQVYIRQQGEIIPPWGVPSVVGVNKPPSITPARKKRQISNRSFSSRIRRRRS